VLTATPLEADPLLRELAPVEEPAWAPAWPPTRAGTLRGVPVLLAASGLGKANAAAAVAALVVAAGGGVKAVLQVGVGGAYPNAGLALGTATAATSELDLDLGLGRHPDWQGLEALAVHGDATANRIDLAGPLLTRVAAATGTPALPFATSDAVTADAAAAAYVARRFGTAVESMEGAGAARAAAALGVPFVEVRGVSNSVGERDKGAWRLREAVAAAGAAALLGLAALWEVLDGPAG